MGARPHGDPPTDSLTPLAQAERDAALRRFAPAKTDGHPEVASAASTPHFFVLSYQGSTKIRGVKVADIDG